MDATFSGHETPEELRCQTCKHGQTDYCIVGPPQQGVPCPFHATQEDPQGGGTQTESNLRRLAVAHNMAIRDRILAALTPEEVVELCRPVPGKAFPKKAFCLHCGFVSDGYTEACPSCRKTTMWTSGSYASLCFWVQPEVKDLELPSCEAR